MLQCTRRRASCIETVSAILLPKQVLIYNSVKCAKVVRTTNLSYFIIKTREFLVSSATAYSLLEVISVFEGELYCGNVTLFVVFRIWMLQY